MTAPHNPTGKPSPVQQDYIARINRVMDYIQAHLDQPLTLHELAEVAHFSRFHFHRIFTAYNGEPLYGYIRRKRLEKAASFLKDNQNDPVRDIAFRCGFSDQAVFSRAFREHFGMSPTEYCRKGVPQLSKERKTDRKIGQTDPEGAAYFRDHISHLKTENMKFDVQIKQMPEMHVAYCRHTGAYHGIEQAFNKLMVWAGPRGLIRFPETRMLGVYHDDPDVTDEKKLQSSACITVPEDTKVSGEIGKMKIEGGTYAVARFEIDETQFGEAWNSVMRDWLPDSGYQCDDRPHYELYHNDPKTHPEKKFILDICIPVIPA
ncbi:MAG: AraC family transcriptional regulator [Bacteroidales bacterium]|nr:AraC family transcriptional regulator [Bacteroidales bacterium]